MKNIRKHINFQIILKLKRMKYLLTIIALVLSIDSVTGQLLEVEGDIKIERLDVFDSTSSVVLGKNAGINLANSNGNNVLIGLAAGQTLDQGFDNVFVGRESGLINKAQQSVMVGANAGSQSLSGGSVFIGQRAGYNAFGNTNVFIGWLSGENHGSSRDNVFIGPEAGRNSSTGGNNVFIGGRAGKENGSGNGNTLIGYFSGTTSLGSGNTFLGSETGIVNTTGHSNTFIGFKAGNSSITDSLNVFIGYEAGSTQMVSNRLFIENSSSDTPLIYGEFDNNKVQVNGSLKITDILNLQKKTQPTGTCVDGDVYMDDGSSRIDSNIGLRYCNTGTWVDL